MVSTPLNTDTLTKGARRKKYDLKTPGITMAAANQSGVIQIRSAPNSDAMRERFHRRIGFALDHADLPISVLVRAERLIQASGLPMIPRLAGVFALDSQLRVLARRGWSRRSSASPCATRDVGPNNHGPLDRFLGRPTLRNFPAQSGSNS